jgi:hypothetical protein
VTMSFVWSLCEIRPLLYRRPLGHFSFGDADGGPLIKRLNAVSCPGILPGPTKLRKVCCTWIYLALLNVEGGAAFLVLIEVSFECVLEVV